MTKDSSVGIAMIATNTYLENWKLTVSSLDQNITKLDKVKVYLFTNQTAEARKWSQAHLQNLEVQIIQIPNYGWPEATLLRYEIFDNHLGIFDSEFIIYLDSDMIVHKPFLSILKNELYSNRIFFVRHPGYVRRKGTRGIFDAILNPKLIKPWIYRILKGNPGMGNWETNTISAAFVPRKLRRIYIHGAIWGGYKNEFLELCNQLSENVKSDLSKNYIAIWHDESHLNYYASKSPCALLDSRYSGYKPYKHLREWPPYISTQIKSLGEGRIPTRELDLNQ